MDFQELWRMGPTASGFVNRFTGKTSRKTKPNLVGIGIVSPIIDGAKFKRVLVQGLLIGVKSPAKKGIS